MTEREDADLAHGDVRFSMLDCALAEIKEHVLHIPQMRREIAETREIVEAWNTAKNTGRFIKWVGVIAAALTASWVFLREVLWGRFL